MAKYSVRTLDIFGKEVAVSLCKDEKDGIEQYRAHINHCIDATRCRIDHDTTIVLMEDDMKLAECHMKGGFYSV